MTEAASALDDISVAPMGDVARRDGRNRRADETRRKIIEAAKAMIAETSEAPTVVGVARRADVSVRSVFQHFGDVQSLFVTVVDSVRDELEVPALGSSDRPLKVRIDGLVQALGELFDKIVPIRVAAGQFVGHPALIERGTLVRQALRQATFNLFAPEFAILSEPGRQRLADAIGAALSLDAWIVLRRREGLSFERAAAAWRLILDALLARGAAEAPAGAA